MRPSSTPATMVAKLSSLSTRSAASRATSVPPRPIATPMLARRSAGASLTPSPVTATKCPDACAAATRSSFCSGVTRAKTLACAIACGSTRGARTRQLGAGQHLAGGGGDAEFARDRQRRQRVVAGDHHHANPRLATAAHGARRAFAQRIDQADQRAQRQLPWCRRQVRGSGTPGSQPSASASTRSPRRAMAATVACSPARAASCSTHISNTRSGAPLTAIQVRPSAAWNVAA